MATVAPVKENKMQDAMVEQVETKSAFINKKYSNEDKLKKEEEELEQLMAEQKGEVEEPEPEPVKEIISVEKIDNMDTETVDNFFTDVSRLMEKKGINVEKNVKSYTLFDDAEDEEN